MFLAKVSPTYKSTLYSSSVNFGLTNETVNRVTTEQSLLLNKGNVTI